MRILFVGVWESLEGLIPAVFLRRIDAHSAATHDEQQTDQQIPVVVDPMSGITHTKQQTTQEGYGDADA